MLKHKVLYFKRLLILLLLVALVWPHPIAIIVAVATLYGGYAWFVTQHVAMASVAGWNWVFHNVDFNCGIWWRIIIYNK